MKRFIVGVVIALAFALTVSGAGERSEKGPRSAPRDVYGDPLPAGVLARMGSVRLDCRAPVLSAAFSADGKSLSVLTSAEEGQLWFFDVATGKTLRRLSLPDSKPGPDWSDRRGSHALTPDNRFVAVCMDLKRSVGDRNVRRTKRIHVLDNINGKPIWQTNVKEECDAMAMSPDGKLLAIRIGDKIRVCDTASGKESLVLQADSAPVIGMAFSADGTTLLAASHHYFTKGNIRSWALPSGKLLKRVSQDGGCHAFSPDGHTLAFCESEKGVALWNLKTERKIADVPARAWHYHLFSPDGGLLVTGSDDEMLRLWDAASGREMRSLQGLVGNGTRPLAFSRDGKVLASWASSHSEDYTVRLWDMGRGVELHPFSGHNLRLVCLAFAGDGQKLISGSDDRTARIWETTTGIELVTYDKHRARVSAVALSSDGRLAASGDDAGVTHVWEAASGRLLNRLAPVPVLQKTAVGVVSCLRFAPDGKTLWVGRRRPAGDDPFVFEGELTLYDVASGRHVHAFGYEPSAPMALSPNGLLAAWGTESAEVSVRRLDTGRELFRLDPALPEPFSSPILDQVVFSPDSRQLAIHWHWHTPGPRGAWIVPCHRLVEVVSGRDISVRRSRSSDVDFPWTIFDSHGSAFVGGNRVYAGGERRDGPAIRVLDPFMEQAVGQLDGHPWTWNHWATDPSGRFFATADHNHTILVWDLTQQGFKRPKSMALAPADLNKLWDDLAHIDADKAHRAAAALTHAPAASVPFLRERLRPTVAVPPQEIVKHIQDLNGTSFVVRDRARAALEKIGELAESALRQALASTSSLEMRRRVELLLCRLDPATPVTERLRTVRAVAVLERAGTVEALAHLVELAKGAETSWLTREARATLQRLGRSRPHAAN